MSFLRSAAAWERTEVGGTDKLVLLALADFENDKTRKCYPTREQIAEKCGISVPTVRRALTQLRAAGLVSWVEGRSGIANEYHFHFVKGQGVTSATGQNDPMGQRAEGQNDPVIGSNLSPQRVKMTPQPRINLESTGESIPSLDRTETDRMIEALGGVCRINPTMNGHKLRSPAGKLIENGYTVEQVKAFSGWWSTHDYRGKNGSDPWPDQVIEHIDKVRTPEAEPKRKNPPDLQREAYKRLQAEREAQMPVGTVLHGGCEGQLYGYRIKTPDGFRTMTDEEVRAYDGELPRA